MLQNERLGSSQVTSASQVTRTGVPACLETVTGPRSLFVLRGGNKADVQRKPMIGHKPSGTSAADKHEVIQCIV